MAQIVINEVSQNYTYNIGTSSYATVAMPITACWGPGYFDPDTVYGDDDIHCIHKTDYMLENTAWQRFPATQEGLQAFVAAYRGPASVYRSAKDYSYQMAMTLLTAGYDVLVCRLCPGAIAQGSLTQGEAEGAPKLVFSAKYPGSFGNNIQIAVQPGKYFNADKRATVGYFSVVTSIVDSAGVKTRVENIPLVFNPDDSTDSILYYSEVESQFWNLAGENLNSIAPDVDFKDGDNNYVRLTGGTDMKDDAEPSADDVVKLINARYNWADDYNLSQTGEYGGKDASKYGAFVAAKFESLEPFKKKIVNYREWLYTAFAVASPSKNASGLEREAAYEGFGVIDLLKDKLAYNPNRLIASGWDDQDYLFIAPDDLKGIAEYIGGSECTGDCQLPISPLHLKIMDVAYYSRCATGFIDIPHVVDRKFVHVEDEKNWNKQGYAQKLARVVPKDAEFEVNGSLFHTHSALFAPWAQYTYVGVGKMYPAAPSFLALMIQRAQILNQAIQYEWALPTNRKHNLKIGKLDYNVPKKILDQWQKLDGASVNVITNIPDLGTNLWGNSTLYEVPPATYQALANLSTRYLVNAVEDTAYRVGISITFQYNNDQAYNKFYAGVTPLLDTMKNVGAIDDYYVKMAADINGLDQVNANTVIGKIYLVVNGVINDIYIDLICLPPGTDLNQYRI